MANSVFRLIMGRWLSITIIIFTKIEPKFFLLMFIKAMKCFYPLAPSKRIICFARLNSAMKGISENSGFKRRNVLIIGVLGYLALMVLAMLLYKERTVFVDIAFHMFCIVNESKFAIQNHRFGAVVTQVFPVVASWLDLSLKDVAIIYSTGFIIWFFSVFLVIIGWFRNARLALGLLLFNTLMVTHTFYWAQSELPQGMGFMVFHFGLLLYMAQRDSVPWYLWLLGISSTGFVIFFHPLSLFAFVFMIAFFALSYLSRWRFFAVAFGAYLFFYALKHFLLPTPYESGAMGGLNNFITLFPNYFTIQSNKNLLRYFVSDYYFIPLLLIAIVAFYIRAKQFLKLALVLSFFFGYILIVNVSYAQGAHHFYIENQYLIFSVFIIIPFVFDVLPAVRREWVAAGIVSCIVLAGIARIWSTHQLYTNRLVWERQLLAKTATLPNKKLIVPIQYVPMDTMIMTWGSPYEFWLLSTLELPETRSVIIEEYEGQFDAKKDCRDCIISMWWENGYDGLNPRYFVMKDTTAYARYTGQ